MQLWSLELSIIEFEGSFLTATETVVQNSLPVKPCFGFHQVCKKYIDAVRLSLPVSCKFPQPYGAVPVVHSAFIRTFISENSCSLWWEQWNWTKIVHLCTIKPEQCAERHQNTLYCIVVGKLKSQMLILVCCILLNGFTFYKYINITDAFMFRQHFNAEAGGGEPNSNYL